MRWTIYKCSSFGATEENKETPSRKFWDTHYVFYMGETIFDENDWRIVEVKDKRKDIELMGIVNDISFPVEYPLKTIGGSFINKIENPILFL